MNLMAVPSHRSAECSSPDHSRIDAPTEHQDYIGFLSKKSQADGYDGFEPVFMPDYLFDFQKHLTSWAIRKGRSALFEDCGLGKTIQGLVWAENVVR